MSSESIHTSCDDKNKISNNDVNNKDEDVKEDEDEIVKDLIQKEEEKEKKKKKKKKKEQNTTITSSSASSYASNSASTSVPTDDSSSFPSLSIHSFFSSSPSSIKSIELHLSRTKGRHVIATKHITPGTPVFTTASYSSVVDDIHVPSYCHRCFKSNPTLYCGKCEYVRFCSKRCRDLLSHTHVLECEALSRMKSFSYEGETAPLRMLMRISFLRRDERKNQKQENSTQKNKTKNTIKVNHTKPGCSFDDFKALKSHCG
jgi:hypothetical protein